MLTLKRMTLSGVGRFVEPQTLDFDSLGNLVQVDGNNRNTGGSSGSGKSTIFNALEYLFGVNDLPTTVIQSRLTKEPLSVSADLDFDGKPLTITRSKKGLIVDLEGEITEGSSKLAEEKLDEIIGMPRDLFRKILHKRQKEGGFFLDFTPKKMFDFLTDAKNLAKYRKDEEIVKNEIDTLEKRKNSIENMISDTNSALKATQDSILSLGIAPVRDIHQSVILELKAKTDKSTLDLGQLIENHKVQNTILDGEKPVLIPTPALEQAEQLPRPTLVDTDLGNGPVIAALEAKISAFNKEAADLQEKERLRVRQLNDKIQSQKMTVMALEHKCQAAANAKQEAVKVAGDIKKIRDAICPTCAQSWVTETAKVKEDELLEKLSSYKKQIAEGASSEQVITEIKADILRMETELTPQGMAEIAAIAANAQAASLELNTEKIKADEHKRAANTKNVNLLETHASEQKVLNTQVALKNQAIIADIEAKNKEAQNQYQIRVSAVREMQAREADQARGQADVDRRAFEAAVNKLKLYEESRSRYDASLAQMKTSESNYLANLDRHKQVLAEVQEKLTMAEELRKAIKTFLSCSFDDALEAISEAATKIIRCIPTMSNATIQFEGQKETKDGKVKEEVNAVISMDGEIGVPIKSLSGGERSSTDLAVDLAVIDFIESETGKGINVFILDEPFTGLDTVSIEMALEVLKNSNTNKKLIVVDHNPEVKQMVSDRVVVVREGSTSTITSQDM